ncbi:MAG: flagella basal body P-ring formation protein FlgA [Sphingorhabdus sp.]
MPFLMPLLIASATPYEDLDKLDARLAEISGGNVVALDRRLRLKPCPRPASIEAQGRSGYEISCPQWGWRIRVGSIGPTDVAALLVQRGETVKAEIAGKTFQVQFDALAMEGGRLGDTIRIRLGDAKRVMTATVTGSSLVRLGN